jgi:hypothetical protein
LSCTNRDISWEEYWKIKKLILAIDTFISVHGSNKNPENGLFLQSQSQVIIMLLSQAVNTYNWNPEFIMTEMEECEAILTDVFGDLEEGKYHEFTRVFAEDAGLDLDWVTQGDELAGMIVQCENEFREQYADEYGDPLGDLLEDDVEEEDDDEEDDDEEDDDEEDDDSDWDDYDPSEEI